MKAEPVSCIVHASVLASHLKPRLAPYRALPDRRPTFRSYPFTALVPRQRLLPLSFLTGLFWIWEQQGVAGGSECQVWLASVCVTRRLKISWTGRRLTAAALEESRT